MAKGQAAIDFLLSYGVAILVITLAIYVILELGIFNLANAPQTCDALPGFACDSYALYPNGTMIIIISQTTGSAINITGVACASTINNTGNFPGNGNLYVQDYATEGFVGYPDSHLLYGKYIYSDGTAELSVKCYNSGGNVATASLGTTFSGYVWLNYTAVGLPTATHVVARALSVTTRYT
jgi:hypothetical protein